MVVNLVTGEQTVVSLTDEEIAEQQRFEIEEAWSKLRLKRNDFLKKSDILVLPDRWESYDSSARQKITDYRQALRDLPQNTVDPLNVSWPVLDNI